MKNMSAEKINNFQDLTETKAIYDFIKLTQLIGNLSAEIHKLSSQDKILEMLKNKFKKSKKYIISILFLTDNGTKLSLVNTSMDPKKAERGEKITKSKLRGYKIDLNKSTIYNRVIKKGLVVQVTVADIVNELFPQPIAYLLSKTFGYHKKDCILTPLYRNNTIIGAVAISSTKLFKEFVPIVISLSKSISTALESATKV